MLQVAQIMYPLPYSHPGVQPVAFQVVLTLPQQKVSLLAPPLTDTPNV